MVCVQLEPKRMRRREAAEGLGYPGRRGVENKLDTRRTKAEKEHVS